MRGFREINEIKKQEIRRKTEEEKGYLKIKPSTNMTAKEARDFWDAEFARIAMEHANDNDD